MFIPRICQASLETGSRARRRRRPRQFAIDLERLEVRTPLSAGLGASLVSDGAAFTPVPGQGPSTIVEGPTIGGSSDGIIPTAPIAPVYGHGGIPAGLTPFGPGGVVALPVGGNELGGESAWGANGVSQAAVPSWFGESMTRDALSRFSTYSDGFYTWESAQWPGDSMKQAANSGLLPYSNGDSEFFVVISGVPGPSGAPILGFNGQFVVLASTSPMTLDSSDQPPIPGGAMDFTPGDYGTPPYFEVGDSGPGPQVYGPGGGIALTIPRGLTPRIETTGTDVDTAFAAPLSSTQASAISSLQLMAVQNAGGRAASGISVQSVGVFSSQIDHAGDSVSGGWMSYIASGEWGSGGIQPSSLSLDLWTTGADSIQDPISPAAITAGGAPLGVLLTGPDLPTQTTTDDLQQVAELIPSDESALALVATLWTVPSDIPTAAQWVGAHDASPEWLTDTPATPSWTAYVIGLDQAFEQSRCEIQQVISPSQERSTPNDGVQLDLDRQLEWERPIMPGLTGWMAERPETSPRDAASVVENDVLDDLAADRLQIAVGSESSLTAAVSQDAPARSEAATFVKAAALPVLSVLSASTAITGWFWTKRRRRSSPPDRGSIN